MMMRVGEFIPPMGASEVFMAHTAAGSGGNWRDADAWVFGRGKLFPKMRDCGTEDPFMWRSKVDGSYHAVRPDPVQSVSRGI